MPSNDAWARGDHYRRQRGLGVVEVLVASALLAVALVVLLGTIAPLLTGARVAERKTVGERLARNAIESLMAQPYPGSCGTQTVAVDATVYTVKTTCMVNPSPGFVEYQVTVSDPSGGSSLLTSDRAPVQ
jgi:Tfp pilus assembly protein PilV